MRSKRRSYRLVHKINRLQTTRSFNARKSIRQITGMIQKITNISIWMVCNAAYVIIRLNYNTLYFKNRKPSDTRFFDANPVFEHRFTEQ